MDRDLDIALSCATCTRSVCTTSCCIRWPRHAVVQGCRAGPRHAEQRHPHCENRLRLRSALAVQKAVSRPRSQLRSADIAAGPTRFRYELASFSIERTDGLGIGPLGLSTFANLGQRRGIKLLRRKSIVDGRPGRGAISMFCYDGQTLPLLFLTRSLAKTAYPGPSIAHCSAPRSPRPSLPRRSPRLPGIGLSVGEGEDPSPPPGRHVLRRCRGRRFADGVRRPGWPAHRRSGCERPRSRTVDMRLSPAGQPADHTADRLAYRAITSSRGGRGTPPASASVRGWTGRCRRGSAAAASWIPATHGPARSSVHSPPGLRRASALPSALPSAYLRLCTFCPAGRSRPAFVSRRARGKISQGSTGDALLPEDAVNDVMDSGDATSAASRSGRPVR